MTNIADPPPFGGANEKGAYAVPIDIGPELPALA
jgi:hypothetical protein